MTSIDDLLAEVSAREVTVRVLLRQDMLAEHARMDAELIDALNTDAKENRDPLGPPLARKLVAFEAEIDAAKRAFTFKAIGKRKWADLIAKHQPTKEQTRANPRLDHNPDTFPAAAVAASCVEPVMTLDQATALETALNLAVFDQLWAACLEANVGGGDSPKSLVAGPIVQVSEGLGITRAREVSRAPSS